MTVEDGIDLRDRANQVALSFVGRRISSADGSYSLLITIVQDAMREWAKIAVEAEREACAKIAEAEIEGASTYQWSHAAESIADKIRARSEGEKKGE